LIDFLGARAGLSRGRAVADVGSGTGIFTRLLVATGATVYAVEPNDAMRAAAEAELGASANFISVKGTAEATGLADHSVSLVTCAQAFHWFDPVGTRREFGRILVPGGWGAVIWNTPVLGEDEFGRGYEKIKSDFGTDFDRVRHEQIEKTSRFDTFFGAGRWQKRSFSNFQTLNFTGLKGRVHSSSYMPKATHPTYAAMIAAVQELFDRCQKGGVVRMDYETELFLGQL
jgi:ubiquinone/menaquinone biosynthesis C-methylase UbiE